MNDEVDIKGRYATAESWRSGVHLALVTDVADPQSLGRVKVHLPAIDPEAEAAIWARVAVPFAGDNFGAFFLPDAGTEVLVAFTAGDAGAPVVIGNFWNGAAAVPEQIGGSSIDRWTMTGKNGTRIAIVEESSGQETVEIETPNGVKAKITDSGGGKITLKAGGQSIKLSPGGIKITSASQVEITGSSMITLSAPMVQIDSPFTQASGMLQCDTLFTNSVISPSYTPGAGNVW
ncbi:phage baseplate assembly protein V [Novosphingobium beihaiensis]|uniref:Phage baseplate assembly protein V n=1 Tax=Novosphingobium beihaiensis TaxID=2930389 RepID=A0ABT0BP54_9SPHN|nr:phage baseplate assembly protein V [Novosphingobium beihaiensis]MCJ2186494.1 phage baseplate assembly protein V [Novosphingobium beihaiensis]